MVTLELTGHALDYAVGLANGWVTYPTDSAEGGSVWHEADEGPGFNRRRYVRDYQPTETRRGDAIIDEHNISVIRVHAYGNSKQLWGAEIGEENYVTSTDHQQHEAMYQFDVSQLVYGETRREAAMRCYVLHKLGPEVSVPEDVEKFWYVPPDDGEPCY